MGEYIAPARRLYHAAHKPDGDDRTACGLDTTDPDELWQPVPAEEVHTICTACLTGQPEELTLL